MVIINFIKSHKKLVLISAIILFFVLLIYFVLNKNKTLQPVNLNTATWNGLQPGKSTKDDVLTKLGQPVLETKNGNDVVDEYKSNSPTRNHQITFNNQIVNLVKRIVSVNDPETIDDISNLYGQTATRLYGDDSENGYFLFVYLSKGIAYLGNPVTGTLLEVWYFPPTLDLNSFIKNYAPNYSDQNKSVSF
jgi:outer membrane protein assembly factor BamE (lipoprotein component of BamABCDE complex)